MIDFSLSRRKAFIILLAVACITLLPFLGLTDFNTKGEPREAVVAFSILEQNNWILPSNNGGEIPYKPPFFHWLIALAGLLNGGVVNEYVSRLPSALALIGMCLGVFAFFSRRKQTGIALLTAVVTLTSFELYRAGMNCRVDMLLTALSVGAMILLYRWWEKGMKNLPWIAILMMSAATLTKGPVGIIIPCLATGIFMLLRGARFFPVFLKLGISAVLALIIPLAWYAAAYNRGGETFLKLVIEENFGRMTGTMTYESHVNPWYYNILTLLAGFLPWTIAAVTALFLVKWKNISSPLNKFKSQTWAKLVARVRNTDPTTLFSLVCGLTVFLFYCIPASKRSVYLMPMYPFTAYFMALLLVWMTQHKRATIRGLGDGIACVGILLFIALFLIRTGIITDSIFGHGRHAAQNSAMLHSLASAPALRTWFCALIPVAAAIGWWAKIRNKYTGIYLPLSTGALVVSLYIAYGGAYQPAVLNAKSMKPMAAEILNTYPDAKNGIYEYIRIAEEATGNPVHYFELDFYMGDPVCNFKRERPDAGYLLIGEDDSESCLPLFEKEGYRFELLRSREPSQPRHTPSLYRFQKEKREKFKKNLEK